MAHEYRAGDLVVITRETEISAMSYKHYLGCYNYPIGTIFRIIRLNASADTMSHALRLIHEGEEVLQTGRNDGCTIGIDTDDYEPYKNKNRRILEAIKSKTYKE